MSDLKELPSETHPSSNSDNLQRSDLPSSQAQGTGFTLAESQKEERNAQEAEYEGTWCVCGGGSGMGVGGAGEAQQGNGIWDAVRTISAPCGNFVDICGEHVGVK